MVRVPAVLTWQAVRDRGLGLLSEVPASEALAPMQAKVAGPLASVQLSRARDVTIWKQGILATPQVSNN